MRLNNLTTSSTERIYRGDIKHLKDVLSQELEALKNDIIYLPEQKVSELRGKAVAIATIIKLLP